MTKPLADLTAAQLAHRRLTVAPKKQLPHDDRMTLAYMAAMGLWPKQHLADLYGITRKSVDRAMLAYPRRTA